MEIEVVRRVSKRSEDENLPIASVDWRRELALNLSLEVLKLGIIAWPNLVHLVRRVSITARSADSSCSHLGKSMSARLIWILPPICSSSGQESSSSSWLARLRTFHDIDHVGSTPRLFEFLYLGQCCLVVIFQALEGQPKE